MERAMLVPAAVKTVFSTIAGGTLLAQAMPATPMTWSIESVTRLGLTGAALIAVAVLWKALQDERKEAKVTLSAVYAVHAQDMAAKDLRIAEAGAQVLSVVSRFTEVTVSVLEAVKELRGAVNELREEHGLTDVPRKRN